MTDAKPYSDDEKQAAAEERSPPWRGPAFSVEEIARTREFCERIGDEPNEWTRDTVRWLATLDERTRERDEARGESARLSGGVDRILHEARHVSHDVLEERYRADAYARQIENILAVVGDEHGGREDIAVKEMADSLSAALKREEGLRADLAQAIEDRNTEHHHCAALHAREAAARKEAEAEAAPLREEVARLETAVSTWIDSAYHEKDARAAAERRAEEAEGRLKALSSGVDLVAADLEATPRSREARRFAGRLRSLVTKHGPPPLVGRAARESFKRSALATHPPQQEPPAPADVEVARLRGDSGMVDGGGGNHEGR